ncbi:MAG: hypothetical protein IM638_14435 [Bacteroidetes bacterium]|nr:hypothetical protein [Bacteroidota bacterium]
MRRLLFSHAWPLCKLSLLICFWFSRITANDMHTLLVRGADERQKAWRLWLQSGWHNSTPEIPHYTVPGSLPAPPINY